jgi:phosphoglycolate phosphatase
MTFDAVIFDLDGTLLDTIDDLADCMNWALAQHGYAPRSREECKHFVGDGVVTFARRALGEHGRDEQTAARVAASLRRRYAQHWADKTRPYPGIAELLEGLRQRGLKTAVFSNKPDDTTQLTVRTLLKDFRFDIVCGALPGMALKPDPAGAIALARDLGVKPDRVLYLGDTDTDMRTAVAAGFFPVGALWGFRTAEELLANGAKVLVEKPQDVLGLLGE